MVQQQDFTRTKNDINGNPRYILHFLNLLTREESNNRSLTIMEKKMIAVNRAKSIGGKTYRGKDYGGGIVFQSYNLQDECDRINKMLSGSDNLLSVGQEVTVYGGGRTLRQYMGRIKRN